MQAVDTEGQFLEIPLQCAIAVFCPEGQFVHPLRLLRQYFDESQLQITSNFEAFREHDAHLAIVLADQHTALPNDMGVPELKTLPEDGLLLRTIYWQDKPIIIAAGGGLPGVIYAVNEFGQTFLSQSASAYIVATMNEVQIPALPYRLLWTWDHSTNWYLEQGGKQELGCFNYYMKPTGGFLEDYQRLIDFMSLNRISGVTIYGFLRDNHGGIEAAQALCRYAKERGVRILPGVGINTYGGIYWEGNHPYNLTQWLKKNPHLRAKFDKPVHFDIPEFPELWFPESSYTDAACPSKPENLQFHCEAIAWLAKNFEIGGINFETGDYGTCQCEDCGKRRDEDSTWSINDMQLLYPQLYEAAKGQRKDLWLVTEMYWDNILSRDKIDPQHVLPDEAIYQFCVNRSYWDTKVQKELTAEYVKNMLRSRNVMRTHVGTQWHHERHNLVAKDFAAMATKLKQTGMRGMTIFAEASAFHVVNEINYLAFARFTYHADMTWEKFLANDLAPRFGSVQAAECYLRFLAIKDQASEIKEAINEASTITSQQTDAGARNSLT